MRHIKQRLTVAGSILFLSFSCGITAYALSSDVFLDASVSPQVIEEAPYATSTLFDSFIQDMDREEGLTGPFQESSSSSTSLAQLLNLDTLRSYVEGGIDTNLFSWERISSFLDANIIRTYSENERDSILALEGVYVEEVGSSFATVAWLPSASTTVKVYYATTSPVTFSPETPSVTARKFWNRGTVTLRGLDPNTTYFYKVVAETDSGTITAAEASFRTVVR